MSAPNAPTLFVVNDGTGTSATATVAGDVGTIHQLYCRRQADAAWTAGETRTGDGAISQTGLVPNALYFFLAVSADGTGAFSLPSNLVTLTVSATATPIKTAIGAAVESLLQTLAPFERPERRPSPDLGWDACRAAERLVLHPPGRPAVRATTLMAAPRRSTVSAGRSFAARTRTTSISAGRDGRFPIP